MRSSILALALAAASASAQSVLDYTKLPACAKQCTVLAQAEGGCVPPAAPVTQQAIYQSCVCQSALLTGLKTSGAQCQATGCSADDAAKITTYYNALCAGPVVEPAATTTTTSTSTATSSTSTATADAAGGNKTSTTKKESWFSTHWKWVVAVIFMAIAALLFGFALWFFKRRQNHKRDLQRQNMAAHNAPYIPPAPSTSSSRPGILKSASSKLNGSTPPPPMTAMSTRPGSMAMDGGVGGVAPPRGSRKLRSRSSTLQSLGLSNGSHAHLPEPVAWGPHQYQAHYGVNHEGSPGDSVPPSPVSAISAPQHPVFRNREFVSSEPRFSSPGTSSSRIAPSQPVSYIERPRTAGEAASAVKSSGEQTPPSRNSRALTDRRVVSYVNSAPALVPQHAEVDFHETSPKKFTQRDWEILTGKRQSLDWRKNAGLRPIGN